MEALRNRIAPVMVVSSRRSRGPRAVARRPDEDALGKGRGLPDLRASIAVPSAASWDS
jgi:hypothetical protein